MGDSLSSEFPRLVIEQETKARYEDVIPSGKWVTIRHPGYPDGSNMLLNLAATDPAIDHDPEHNNFGGALSAEFALLACGIVVGNRWDGYLSTNKAGDNEVDMLSSMQRDYYYHVKSTDNAGNEDRLPYAVVPNFENWAFPHNNLPPLWRKVSRPKSERPKASAKSQVTVAVAARDESCVLSRDEEGMQSAHLCPKSQVSWFDKNEMVRYNANQQAGGMDPANFVLLRADLHSSLDALKFVIVPKSTSSTEAKFVTHCLAHSRQLLHQYHNKITKPMLCSYEAILVRIAWAIFPCLDQFFAEGKDRRIRIPRADSAGVEDKMVSSAVYNQLRGTSKKRTNEEADEMEDQPKPKKKKGSSNAGPSKTKTGGNKCAEGDTNGESLAKYVDSYGDTDDEFIRVVMDGKEGCADMDNGAMELTEVVDDNDDDDDDDGEERSLPRRIRLENNFSEQPDRDGLNHASSDSQASCIFSTTDSDAVETAFPDADFSIRMLALREKNLTEERQRSDPQGNYRREKDWAEEICRTDQPMTAEMLKRFTEFWYGISPDMPPGEENAGIATSF